MIIIILTHYLLFSYFSVLSTIFLETQLTINNAFNILIKIYSYTVVIVITIELN